MDNTAELIKNFISTPNISASNMTSGLAKLGNGSMQNGIKQIVEYFSKSSLNRGRMQGGLATVVICGCIAGGIIYHNKKERQLEDKGQIILNTLQESTNEDSTKTEKIDSISE